MSYRIMRHPCGVQKRVKVGFSWTTMFFDFLPSVFRGEWGSAIKLFIIGPLTFGIYNVFKWFSINEDYYESLLMKGFTDISDEPWKGPQKENAIVRIYKTFYECNPIIYKKCGMNEILKKFKIKQVLRKENTATVQTGLIILFMIINVYKFLTNVQGIIYGFNSIISTVSGIFIYDLFILAPIFIIISLLMIIFTIDIENENIKEVIKEYEYQKVSEVKNTENISTKINENKMNIQEENNYNKQIIIKKSSNGIKIIAIIELLIIIGLGVALYNIYNSQTYTNGQATTSVINAADGSGSAQQAEQSVGNAVEGYINQGNNNN